MGHATGTSDAVLVNPDTQGWENHYRQCNNTPNFIFIINKSISCPTITTDIPKCKKKSKRRREVKDFWEH